MKKRFFEISKKTAIPITIVCNRIKKLEKFGIIKNYTIVLDNKKIGKELGVYILITFDYKLLKEKGLSQYQVAEKIKKYDTVEEVNMITGQFDIVAKIRVKNIEEASDFVTKELRDIDGIEKTQTMVILSEI